MQNRFNLDIELAYTELGQRVRLRGFAVGLSEKIGLGISAVGVLFGVFQVFWPGKISQMPHHRRLWVFGSGAVIFLIGLSVAFLVPNHGDEKQPISSASSFASGQGAISLNQGSVTNNFGVSGSPKPAGSSQDAPNSETEKLRHKATNSELVCATGANCSLNQTGGVSIGTQNNYGPK